MNIRGTFRDADIPSLTLEANSVISEAPGWNSDPPYWSDSVPCLFGPTLSVIWSGAKIMTSWTEVTLQCAEMGQGEREKPHRPWTFSLKLWRDISGGYIKVPVVDQCPINPHLLHGPHLPLRPSQASPGPSPCNWGRAMVGPSSQRWE